MVRVRPGSPGPLTTRVADVGVSVPLLHTVTWTVPAAPGAVGDEGGLTLTLRSLLYADRWAPAPERSAGPITLRGAVPTVAGST